jgi:Retrotransposon gag protein
MLAYSSTKLSGIAFCWMRGLQPRPQSWKDFKDTLADRFTNCKHERLCISRLNTLEYRNPEEYIKDFTMLLEQIRERR